MRKSTGVIMTIILVAMVGMMFAANVAMKPYQRYARIGKEVKNILLMRGELEKSSKVFILGKVAGEKNLAEGGFGLLIELTPAEAVRTQPGRLRRLAVRAAREASLLYSEGRGNRLEWVEVKLEFGPEQSERTLMLVGPEGQLGAQIPALPEKHVPVRVSTRP